MKHWSSHRYRKREMMQDTFIVLGPPILMLIGILWFFSDEWLPKGAINRLASFVDSFLTLLTG